jgi:hypothetical protein
LAAASQRRPLSPERRSILNEIPAAIGYSLPARVPGVLRGAEVEDYNLLDLLMLGQGAWDNLVAVTLGLAVAVALVRMVREGVGSGERGVTSQINSRDQQR